jgi:hypothetical protein
MKFLSPWISRRDHNATIRLYEDFIAEDHATIISLRERITYLEREREAIRLASLTPEPQPITILNSLDAALDETAQVIEAAFDEDLDRWEAEGGAIVDDGNGK